MSCMGRYIISIFIGTLEFLSNVLEVEVEVEVDALTFQMILNIPLSIILMCCRILDS